MNTVEIINVLGFASVLIAVVLIIYFQRQLK